GPQALPAAAAAATPAQSNTFAFHLGSDQDVTHFLAQCPVGTPAPYVLCGYGINEPITSQSSTLAALNTPGITESFVSALSAAGPQKDCAIGMTNVSAVTLHTSRGDIFLASSDHGQFCVYNAMPGAAGFAPAKSNLDVEPFVILGGTGQFRGATGSGVITAHGLGQDPAPPATPTIGYATEVYDGTITLAAPAR
ncbi:MAG TPA: hypothetical protein VGQ62_09150, partial [Chloroflexota bacterium]|nr:hypothetical protein [Chloroflexota bacterium]